MANAIFNKGREGFATALIDWDTAAIKVALVRGYTYNSAHQYVSDVTGAGGVLHVTSTALASKTATDGICDAADLTLTAVTTNASSHSLLVFQASAVTGGADVAASAQRLICWYDSGPNLPIIPNGADIVIAWDNTSTVKMFKL